MAVPEKRFIRQYINVDVSFDPNGKMRPRVLTWTDGSKYAIDRVLDMRPAHAARAGGQGDRYRVRIHGKERELFFEHNPEMSSMFVGRWFVETKV